MSSSTALSSSSVNGLHQRIAFSSPPSFLLPQRFLSAKLSLQCRRNSHPNMVLMEDGNFILYSFASSLFFFFFFQLLVLYYYSSHNGCSGQISRIACI